MSTIRCGRLRVAWAAIACAAIGAFRPADAGIFSLAVGSVPALAAFTSWKRRSVRFLRRRRREAAAAAAMAGLILLFYLIVNGWKQNSYPCRRVTARLRVAADPDPLGVAGRLTRTLLPHPTAKACCIASLHRAGHRRLCRASHLPDDAAPQAGGGAGRRDHGGAIRAVHGFPGSPLRRPVPVRQLPLLQVDTALLALYALRLAILLAFGPDRWRRAATPARPSACCCLDGGQSSRRCRCQPRSRPRTRAHSPFRTSTISCRRRRTRAGGRRVGGDLWRWTRTRCRAPAHEIFSDVRLFPQPNGFMVAPMRTLGSGPGELPDAKVVKSKGVMPSS